MKITKCRTYETTSIYSIELTEEKLRSLFNKTIEELQKDGFEQFKKKYFSDEKLIKSFLLNGTHIGMLENSMADRLEDLLLDGWWDDQCGEETATTIEIDDDL